MLLGDLATAGVKLPGDAGAVAIAGVSADSRTAGPGFLFVALAGATTDGARFASDAVRRGAVAVLAGADAKLGADLGVPVATAEDPRRALALIAARFHPRQPECLVAVTGTSGKTSVAAFARQIFEAAGMSAASIGTLGVVSRDWTEYGSLTTPDPVALHVMLERLAAAGVTHAAVEASSHGLDQRRLDGLRIVAAGFTNLGRDHMDYHPTIADYLGAKLRLFTAILPKGGTAVVDMDGDYSEDVALAAAAGGAALLRVGRKGRDLRLLGIVPDGFRQRLDLEAFGRKRQVLLPLAGAFQASNALVAAGLAIGAGIERDAALSAIETLAGAPGRIELVGRKSNGALVFVDYAHKPEAIESVLSALRPMATGRLVVVFGAGGDRDRGKRPLMGAAAHRLADIVIVTDDNPRSEDPAAIRQAILAAAPGATEIGDRAAAIGEAIALLRAGDVLCIAGKGHETGQIVGAQKLEFSDHDVARRALRREAAA